MVNEINYERTPIHWIQTEQEWAAFDALCNELIKHGPDVSKGWDSDLPKEAKRNHPAVKLLAHTLSTAGVWDTNRPEFIRGSLLSIFHSDHVDPALGENRANLSEEQKAAVRQKTELVQKCNYESFSSLFLC